MCIRFGVQHADEAINENKNYVNNRFARHCRWHVAFPVPHRGDFESEFRSSDLLHNHNELFKAIYTFEQNILFSTDEYRDSLPPQAAQLFNTMFVTKRGRKTLDTFLLTPTKCSVPSCMMNVPYLFITEGFLDENKHGLLPGHAAVVIQVAPGRWDLYDFSGATPEKALIDAAEQLEEKGCPKGERAYNDNVPEELKCPLTHRRFRDPVLAKDGNTYERSAILKHLEKSTNSPLPPHASLLMDGKPFLVPNRIFTSLLKTTYPGYEGHIHFRRVQWTTSFQVRDSVQQGSCAAWSTVFYDMVWRLGLSKAVDALQRWGERNQLSDSRERYLAWMRSKMGRSSQRKRSFTPIHSF